MRQRTIKFGGNDVEQFIYEREVQGVTPEQLEALLIDIKDFLVVNHERITKYVLMVEDTVPGGLVQTHATYGKKKAFFSGRLGMDTKIFFPGEHLFL